jgi:hypothetical protein
MTRVQLLIPVWILIFFYGLLNIVLGDNGTKVYASLEQEKSILDGNIENLLLINQKLVNELNSLQNNDELIVLEAQNLGYGPEGSYGIHLIGRGAKRPEMNAGTLVEVQIEKGLPDWTIKKLAFGISVCCSLFSLIILMIKRFKRPQPRPKTCVLAK